MKGKIILIAGFAVAALAYFVVEGYWSDGQEAPPFDAPEHEKTVILVYDMTPSYAELMTKDGAAYKFSLRVVDSYVRTNGSDKIILAQIAGKDSKAITWDGKPADLIRAFPDAEAFKKFLEENAGKPEDSRVFDSLADVIEYSMRQGGPVVCISLTDMVDNVNHIDGEKRLLDVLTEFGKQGHAIGIYWIKGDREKYWSDQLASRFKPRHWIVKIKEANNPPLPQLD